MRKAQLLTTAAAVLLIGTAAASAQATKKESPAPTPAAQQNAPAEKVAPAMKPGENKAGAETKQPQTVGQAPKATEPDKGAASKGAMDKSMDKGAAAQSSAETTKPADANGSVNIKSKTDTNSAQAPATSKSSQSATPAQSSTTGQGAAAGSAKLSTEQRTKITSVIRQQKVAPVKLNVSVRVGTRIPANVHFYPLPQEVVVIYPEWRGYDYILVGDQIVIVDPRTHEIVAILEA